MGSPATIQPSSRLHLHLHLYSKGPETTRNPQASQSRHPRFPNPSRRPRSHHRMPDRRGSCLRAAARQSSAEGARARRGRRLISPRSRSAGARPTGAVPTPKTRTARTRTPSPAPPAIRRCFTGPRASSETRAACSSTPLRSQGPRTRAARTSGQGRWPLTSPQAPRERGWCRSGSSNTRRPGRCTQAR